MNTPAAVDPVDTPEVRAIQTLVRGYWHEDLNAFAKRLGLNPAEPEARTLFVARREAAVALGKFSTEQLLKILTE